MHIRQMLAVLCVSVLTRFAYGGDDVRSSAHDAAFRDLSELQDRVASVALPATFDQVFEALGGGATLSMQTRYDYWRDEQRRSKAVFSVLSPALRGYRYVVEFEGEDLSKKDSVVTRVRIGFQVPLGGTYYADPEWEGWQTVPPRPSEPGKKGGEPGATDNPDDAQRVRED